MIYLLKVMWLVSILAVWFLFELKHIVEQINKYK